MVSIEEFITTNGGHVPVSPEVEIARLKQEIRDQEEVLLRHKVLAEDAERRYSRYRDEVTHAHRDLEIIARMLQEEAVRRNWCSEYDEFVDSVNGETYNSWLEKIHREWNVTLSVTYSGTGPADADEIASLFENLRAPHVEGFTVVDDNIEVEEAD